MGLLIVFAIMLFFVALYDRESRRRFAREQQDRRDQQILEWDRQLQQYPWLRDVYAGRITQEDIDAAKGRQHPEENIVEWTKEGF